MTSVTCDSVEKITSPLSIHDIINKVVVVSCCYNIGIFYPANFSDQRGLATAFDLAAFRRMQNSETDSTEKKLYFSICGCAELIRCVVNR